MSKFDIGQRVKIICNYTDDSVFIANKGASGIIKAQTCCTNDRQRVYFDSGKFAAGNMGGLGWAIPEKYLKLVGASSKPAKKHTESDRRKAAKAIRILEKKIAAAIQNAISAGIQVDTPHGTIKSGDNLEPFLLSYFPPTPKKRVYK